MREAGPENRRDWISKVREKLADVGSEHDGAAHQLETVHGEPVTKRYYHAKIATGQASVVELVYQFFHALDWWCC